MAVRMHFARATWQAHCEKLRVAHTHGQKPGSILVYKYRAGQAFGSGLQVVWVFAFWSGVACVSACG